MSEPENDVAPSIVSLGSREVYRNHWMRVREDEILRSNGQKGIYGVVDKPDSAIVIPLEDDRIWLVEQYRYPVLEPGIEFPQGSWDVDSPEAEALARGELREEMGIEAAQMIRLGSLWIAYGFLHQKQHVYLATGLTRTERQPDPEEHDLSLRSCSIAEFEQMILDGEIRDGCSVAAWGLYLLRKAKQK